MGASSKPARNPHQLSSKVCVVCERPFTWRKKWERCWDEVTTCSKRCNAERKKRTRDGAGSDLEEGAAPIATGVDEAKRAAKKEAKAERRAIRAGRADARFASSTPVAMCVS